MRVTKTIREYIEKEVVKRLYPKYQAEEAEAKRQSDAHDAFLEALSKAAAEAYTKYYDEHFSEIADFCEDSRTNIWGKNLPNFYNSRAVTLRDYSCITSVHKWHTRMNDEAKNKVNDIILTLELGGTRAELESMLAKVGE